MAKINPLNEHNILIWYNIPCILGLQEGLTGGGWIVGIKYRGILLTIKGPSHRKGLRVVTETHSYDRSTAIPYNTIPDVGLWRGMGLYDKAQIRDIVVRELTEVICNPKTDPTHLVILKSILIPDLKDTLSTLEIE